jgi:hypothetical protein
MRDVSVEPAEQAEIDALRDLYEAAPPEVAARHGIQVQGVGGATCIVVAATPDETLFNRSLGLGLARPASEEDVEAVCDFYRAAGAQFYLQLSPDAQPPELAQWVSRRGFTPGYAWAKFRRGTQPLPPSDTDLRIERIGPERGRDFGRVFVEGYGTPEFLGEWLAAVPGRPGWYCYLAFDGDEPAASAALYAGGRLGWFGFAATLPAFRRRGAQSALLAARIRDGAALGCEVLITETGERLRDRPSNSYRNIERSGFEFAYVRQNYLSPPDARR